MNKKLKIVVIGGSGLIGKKLVDNLRQQGHEVVAASPSSGVNTLTGEGLAEALAGARVVVDVSNSASFSFIPRRGALYQWESEDNAALEFFETSGRNLLVAEAAAGVGHHVALSVVGTDRLQESGYFHAKMAQENLIKGSTIPYTIVRATQFFEFMGGIAQSGTVGQTVHLSPALVQPIAADDVANALAEVTLGAPVQGIVEIAGPERVRLDELVRRFLRATKDSREVITDVQARYFGLVLNDQSLTPGVSPRIGPMRFDEWLSRPIAQKQVKKAAPVTSSIPLAPQKITQADKANSIEPERALAAGVLRQAASDLRRFRESEDAVGREMYWDARSWFVSNDTEWPYSFLSVCHSLGIAPENIRDEVFADAQSRWLSHSRRVALATATQLVRSLSTLFSSRRSGALAVRHS